MVFGDNDANLIQSRTDDSEVKSAEPAGRSADQEFIGRQLLAHGLGHTPTAAIGNVAVAAVACLVFARSEPPLLLAAWLALLTSSVLARLWFARRWLPRLAQLDNSAAWRVERRFTALIVLTGAIWGLLPWIGYNGRDPFLDFYTAATVVGITAGASNNLSAVPAALRWYLSVALLPFAARMAQVGGAVSLGGAAGALLVLAVLASFGRNNYRSLRDHLRITRQNARLAQQLRQERDALHAAMRAKDLFQAGVTHDLRQPVHALALHLHYLRSLRPDEWAGRNVDEAWRAVETALKFMSDQLTRLLDLSRLESGEVRAVIEDVQVADILHACLAKSAPQAAAKGLRLRARPARAVVRSDPKMLQSIVDNFVSNAVRYTRSGGVLVAARRRRDHIEIQVFDTGPGIAPQIVPQLFVPYRRFDDRRQDDDSGHGLGLALARKQADLLGHALAVRSVPARGSTFAVRLPIAARAP
jgi:signal transduction histidine kinase